MTNFAQQERDAVTEHLSQLVGGTVVRLIVDSPSEEEQEYGCEPFYGFSVQTRDGKLLNCFIQRDVEGNGAGFLNIEEDQS